MPVLGRGARFFGPRDRAIEKRLRGADPAETYTKLSELRSAYSTALQVAASGKKQSLFDLM
ncbi:MAG: hypothetical protein FJ090_04610 [Deltaproteobacteria bacterium]|nr:hypothetical protein [Deltaproteobacteria bacterium]